MRIRENYAYHRVPWGVKRGNGCVLGSNSFIKETVFHLILKINFKFLNMSDRVLPKDVWVLIFKKLPLPVTVLCRQVCKDWNEIISTSRVLWKCENYEKFCRKIRDIPLKYHYMFKPRRLGRKQTLMFLDMCHNTTEKQLVRKYKLATKEQVAKIDMKRFCNGTMLYLIVKKKISIEQLSLISVPHPENNYILNIFSDIGVWYLKSYKNVLDGLYNKSFVEIGKKLANSAARHLEKHLSEGDIIKVKAIENERTRRFVLAVVFSPYGRMFLEKGIANIDQIIARPLDFCALTRNEHGLIGLQKGIFTLDQVLGDTRVCSNVCNQMAQEGLKFKLFTVDELKTADRLILKHIIRYGRGWNCLLEKLFTLDDCKKLLFPEYFRFLVSKNGIIALKEGLVTLENVSLLFQWDDPTLIPKKMTDEHLSDVRQLKKLKIDYE